MLPGLSPLRPGLRFPRARRTAGSLLPPVAALWVNGNPLPLAPLRGGLAESLRRSPVESVP